MPQLANTYEDAVGLNAEDAVDFVVETAPLSSPFVDEKDSIGAVSDSDLALAISSMQGPTVLDEAFHGVPICKPERGGAIEVNIPTPRDVVVASALPGSAMPTMVIYPPPTSRQHLTPGILVLPTFRVTYVVRDVPSRCHPATVGVALDAARRRFEGDVCLDLLMKAVRSQRNVLKEPFDMDAVGHAMLILERDGIAPHLAIINPDANAIVRSDIEENGGLLRGMRTFIVVPSRRGNEGRSYFLSSPLEVGTVAKSDPAISREKQDDGCLSILWSLLVGMMVTNRACISAIDD